MKRDMNDIQFAEKIQSVVDVSTEVFDSAVPFGSMVTRRTKVEPLMRAVQTDADKLALRFKENSDFDARIDVMRESLGTMYYLKTNNHEDKYIVPHQLMMTHFMLEVFAQVRSEFNEQFSKTRDSINQAITIKFNKIESNFTQLEKALSKEVQLTHSELLELREQFESTRSEIISNLQELYKESISLRENQDLNRVEIQKASQTMREFGLNLMDAVGEVSTEQKFIVHRVNELYEAHRQAIQAQRLEQQYQGVRHCRLPYHTEFY